MLLLNRAVPFINNSQLGHFADRAGLLASDLQPTISHGRRAFKWLVHFKSRQGDRGDQPFGLDWHNLTRVGDGELLVAAYKRCLRLLLADPEPENLVVAAQVEFGIEGR